MNMPRPRWPHLLREVSRHGTVRWVVRIGHGARTTLTAAYGTPEFEAKYHAAIKGQAELAKPKRQGNDTFAWLVARYQDSSKWRVRAKATQKKRLNFLKQSLADCAEMPYSEITRHHIRDGMERRKPSQANGWLDAMRSLFKWAVKNEFVAVNPTEGIESVEQPKSEGFRAWDESDIEAFERVWGVGTRERLAYSLLRYTGLRRGDCAKLGRQHIRNGCFVLRTEKTGTQVTIPILPELQRYLDDLSMGLTFVAMQNGKPLTKDAFGNWFSAACKAAGVKGSPCHGLRKYAATSLINAGVPEAELEAIMAWTPGSGMSRVYTRNRDNERLSRQAMNKLATSYSQPNAKVGNGE